MRTPRPSTRPRLRRSLRGLRGTAVAVAATALLTASQAPDVLGKPTRQDDGNRTDPIALSEGPLPHVDSQGDDSYHTELPPLTVPDVPDTTYTPSEIRAESGIPATVLAAYRRAESSVGRTDPGCRLPWQLLAAIGKVESGQARGGDVDANGTTRHRITGPPLNGKGFALIRDTENGVWDGDPVYDRAVGPMQFLPGTWRRWGADGNGDGTADPNNIYDAALAAGHYLCAGSRDVGTSAGLERAILSYNYSRDYLRTVLYWMEFYRKGVHTVADGKGTIPVSPGAGSDTQATEPVGDRGGDKGGGIVIGPDPTPTRKPTTSPSPGPSPTTSGEPSPTPGPSDSGTTEPPTDPPTTGEPPVTDEPTDSSPDPTDCPSDTADPTDTPSPTDTPTESASPCATPGA
ncbi:lytic transglycosylase domain-containing protein [Streptomyces sp. VRA16 Mangrove soil]|uniref:lytic transglycosylase domain-containing protein n=1 Tax=Streptomyces sp. VRA16 Mangrove soil TaxID=2817434 RepID=UPI001A9EB2FA|nr:lytic transglycosylase domain-containing protein [Streptomyces sp. VRA16 Mangrove soil]MBO1333131.1 lytic murein transglycosylase [Streptomyces sp. VRA16 Mangrove soil]